MDYKREVEELKNGSYKGFKILYDAFSDNLYGFVLSLVKSEQTAKEIVHETFIKLWVNRQNIDPDQSIKAYLYAISKNNIIDSYRKQVQNPIVENYLDHCNSLKISSNNVTEKIDYDSFVEKLEKAKNKLTPRQVQIFEMSKEQGMTSAQIAKELNISEQTTYNILATATKIVRNEIGTAGLILFALFFE